MKRSMLTVAGLSVIVVAWGALAGAQDTQGPSKTLHVAAMDGDVEQIQLHIARGANVNKPDNQGTAPLCYAAEHGGAEAVKLLLNAGAQVDAKGSYGRTPIMGAAQTGKKDVVDMLIAAGANVKAKDDNQATALHLAATWGQFEIAEALVKAGADVNAEDKVKQTPLTMATTRRESAIVELLKQHGAKEPVLMGPGSPYDEYGSVYGGAQQGLVQSVAQTAPADVEIDPNLIRQQVAAFQGLAEAIKTVDDKSLSEQRGWIQRRLDNRAILIRAADKQFGDELAFVKKIATEEKAGKTSTAIDGLAASRKLRGEQIAKELLAERRMAMQAEAGAAGMNRGRTAVRGRTSRDTFGQSSMNPYETSTTRMPVRASRSEPNEPPIDPVTQAQVDAWLNSNLESKDTLLEAVHKQDLADLDAVRTVATEEEAKKTGATLSGLMLARQLRVEKIRQEWLEDDERMQKLQERMGPEGMTRGRGTRGPTQQNDQTTRGRRYR